MVDDPRPAPPVTIRDPSRSYGAAEVLDAGPDGGPDPSPVTTRRLALAGAVVLAGALVTGGAELRDRRAASEQERRLASAVELVAEPQGSSASFDPLSRTSVVQLDVRVRNDGPREVTVESGRVGDFTTSDDRRIRPGSARPLLLRGVVACPDEPPPPQEARGAEDGRTLSLVVRTGAGVRPVDVPLPASLTDGLVGDVCGFPSPGQDTSVALSAELLRATADDGVCEVAGQGGDVVQASVRYDPSLLRGFVAATCA